MWFIARWICGQWWRVSRENDPFNHEEAYEEVSCCQLRQNPAKKSGCWRWKKTEAHGSELHVHLNKKQVGNKKKENYSLICVFFRCCTEEVSRSYRQGHQRPNHCFFLNSRRPRKRKGGEETEGKIKKGWNQRKFVIESVRGTELCSSNRRSTSLAAAPAPVNFQFRPFLFRGVGIAAFKC